MSVQNVTFNAWKATLPQEAQALPDETLQQMFNSARGDTNAGIEVEHVEVPEGEEGNTQARSEAYNSAVEELKQIKQQSDEKQQSQLEKSAKTEAGEYAPTTLRSEERFLIERGLDASNKDKAFYKNRKARKEVKKLVEDAIIDAFDEKEIDYKKKDVRKWTKAYTESLETKDKVEHTRVFEKGSEKRQFRRATEEEDLRLKKHNKRFIKERNQNLHGGETVKGGASLHQGAYEQISDTIGADLEANPNEVKNVTDDAALKRKERPARKEIKKLGYDVQKDGLKGAVGALVPALGAGIGAAAFPTVAEAVAVATATVLDPDGNVLANSSQTATDKDVSFNIRGAGTAAAAAGILAAAMFGGSEDEHVLNGTQIDKVFTPSVEGKKFYETATFGKYTDSTKTILTAIDKIEGLTDEQKTNILKIASGEDSREFLSSKELVAAYMLAVDASHDPSVLEEVTPEEEQCPPCETDCDCESDIDTEPTIGTDTDIDTDVTPDTETDVDGIDQIDQVDEIDEVDIVKPEYQSEITEEPIKEEVPIETALPHRSNELYGWNIAQEGYYLENGKPLTNKQIKEIIDVVYTQNEVRRKQDDGSTKYVIPKTWILKNEITLKDGTVVKLKEYEELLKIKGEKSDASEKVGFDKNRNGTPATEYRVVGTAYGFVIQKKEPGADDWTTVHTQPPTGNYKSQQEALEAANKKMEELKAQDGAQQ